MFTNYGKRLIWQVWLTACDYLHGRQKFIAFDFYHLVSVLVKQPKESLYCMHQQKYRQNGQQRIFCFLQDSKKWWCLLQTQLLWRLLLISNNLSSLLCDLVLRWNSSKCKMIPPSTFKNNRQNITLFMTSILVSNRFVLLGR